MLFKPEHQKMILNGTKTATRRVWKRPMVKVGGIYKAKLKMLDKKYFAKIKVTKLYLQQLGEMTNKDAKKEGYPNLMEFHDKWVEINGWWIDNKFVDVIEFEVIKSQEKKG